MYLNIGDMNISNYVEKIMLFSKPADKNGIMPKKSKLLKSFKKNDEGATAIEFAIVAGPFFLLIFAIIETTIFFFASQYLENSVDEVTRKLRTGQLKNITTAQDFQTEICNEVTVLFDCNNIKTRVEVAATFNDLSEAPQPKDDGSGNVALDDADFFFQQPGPLQIVQVTATYEWPIYTNYAAPLITSGLGGSALINSSAVVRTEPFTP